MRLMVLCAAAVLALIGPAIALNDTIGVTAGSGKTANLIKFGSNNVISEVGNCDPTTENQCGAVKAGNTAATTDIAVVVSDPNVLAAAQAPLADCGATPCANKIGLTFSALAPSGGYTTTFFQPAASDNHTNVKNGAGQVYWVLAENNSATINYLRLYNAASGFNGCNSATNLISQIQIPANTAVGGVNLALPFGIPFSTGISYCVTSGYATNDTTNATASAMSITIGYN